MSIAHIPHRCTLKCVHEIWVDACPTRSCRAKQVSEGWSQLDLTRAGCIKLQGLQNGQWIVGPCAVSSQKGAQSAHIAARTQRWVTQSLPFPSVMAHSSRAALGLIHPELRVGDDVM